MQGKPRKLFFNQVKESYHAGGISDDDYEYYIRELNSCISCRRKYEKGEISDEEMTLIHNRFSSIRWNEIFNDQNTFYLIIKL